MAIRFRKYIKLAPGLRVNLTGSGVSWTVGAPGASVGIGRRGAYLNTGIPGSGFYQRQKLGAAAQTAQPNSRSGRTQHTLNVQVNDDGVLTFTDMADQPVSADFIDKAKRQQGDAIKALIQTHCDTINSRVSDLARIHHFTTPPLAHRYDIAPFAEPPRDRPTLRSPGFFCKLSKSCRAKVEAANKQATDHYESQMEQWRQRKAQHEDAQRQEELFFQRLNEGDLATAEQYYSNVLQDITWPKETDVSFEIAANGVMLIDVDLPEIEDMPTKIAAAPQRGYKLSVKEMNATQVRKLYMEHIHAVGFRVAGEAFAVSPAVSAVVLSAYTQRADKATGQVSDQYLYSVRIARDKWLELNFKNIEQIDAMQALAGFDMKRTMSETGVFKAIEPYSGIA